MSKKEKFLDFFDCLIINAKEPVVLPKEVEEFYNMLRNQKDDESDKPLFTESGLMILEWMQNNAEQSMKAKDIAAGMGESTRKISGSMRKLVTDGFVEKFGKDPITYFLTDLGKNYNIQAYKQENKQN